jgi:hypothetical protein
MLEEADLALKRTEDKDADEARVRIMEANRDRLVALVDTVQDETEEKDQDQLINLGEEVEYNKDNVASMAKMMKGTVDEGLSKRAQRAFDESMEAAKLGWQKLEGLRTRLEFHSVDSEAGSYLGGATRGVQEAGGNPAQEWPPAQSSREGQAAGGGRQEGSEFYFRAGQDGRVQHEAGRGPVRGQGGQKGPVGLAGLLRGWGHFFGRDLERNN